MQTSSKWAPDIPGPGQHDAVYEKKAVLLLFLGFGLVGFDRMMILPMFPTLMRELSLTYADIGLITGSLAISWAFCAVLAGHVSDRFGYRRTLVLSMVAFSILVGVTGFASGLPLLVLMRALMGAAEGAFVPPSIAATSDAARPSRRGFVLGIQQMASPLAGLTLAPVLVTQLLHVVPWRFIFILLAVPGLVMAFFLHRTIRDQPRLDFHRTEEPLGGALKKIAGVRNVRLLMLLMLCLLSVLIVLSALLPSYLADILQLSTGTAGGILSAMGIGAVCGSFSIPALSDVLGRRVVLILAAIGLLGSITLVSFIGADPFALFLGLFAILFFNFGMLTLVVAVMPGEVVPRHQRALATGIIIFAGEIFGGGLAPVIAGTLADSYGLYSIFPFTGLASFLAIVSALFISETKPRMAGLDHHHA